MHGIPSNSLQAKIHVNAGNCMLKLVCAIAQAYRTDYLCVNYMRFHNKQRDKLLIPVTFVHVYTFTYGII